MIRAALRVAYGYLVLYSGLTAFGLGCLVWSAVAALLCHVLPTDRGKDVGRSMTGHSLRFCFWVLSLSGAFRFDLRALDSLRDAGPMVIAPNHPSLLDAAMVLSRLPRVVCVMKTTLIENPFYGAPARLAGYIRNDDFIGAVALAVHALKTGDQLLLFPEGTRTTQAPINRLKGGAALVSKRSGVPIQTVLIETTSPFLSKGWPLYRMPPMPICYRVRLGRRFMPADDLKESIAELEAYLASELGSSRDIDSTGSLLEPQSAGLIER